MPTPRFVTGYREHLDKGSRSNRMQAPYCFIQNVPEWNWLPSLHVHGAQGAKVTAGRRCLAPSRGPAVSPTVGETADVSKAPDVIRLFCRSQQVTRLGILIRAHAPSQGPRGRESAGLTAPSTQLWSGCQLGLFQLTQVVGELSFSWM